jgi:hypothetical protein
MIITLFGILVLVIGIVGFQVYRHNGEEWAEMVGGMCSIVGGAVLFFCLLCIVVAPIKINGDLADYNALKSSLDMARVNPAVSPIELAAIQKEVIAFNRQLARDQYWTKNPWTKWFRSQRVFEMNPIR